MNFNKICLAIATLLIIAGAVYVIRLEETYKEMNQGVAALHQSRIAAVEAAAQAVQSTSESSGVFSTIVIDCALDDRTRLDELLSSLATLTLAELEVLDRLYATCGNFFELQRALKAKQLEFQVENLSDFYEQFPPYVTSDNKEDLETWRQIVSLENEIANKMMILSSIQADIITALVAGEQPGGDAIVTLLSTAQELRENVSFSSQEATALRATINP